jgi:hypothetical protein
MLALINISKIIIYNHGMGVFDQNPANQADRRYRGE